MVPERDKLKNIRPEIQSSPVGGLGILRESLELMTSRPYFLQALFLMNAMLRVRRFYKKHHRNFIPPDQLHAMISRAPTPSLGHLAAEYVMLEKYVRKGHHNTRLVKRMDFALTCEEGFILYLTIRACRPDLVLETGVANGFSTRIILEALAQNEQGLLVSVETSKNVGILVKDSLKSRWQLAVGRPRKVLIDTLDQIGRIDVFLHDSNHSYENMLFELTSIYPRMSRPGVMLSDDADVNPAFFDFAEKIGKRPSFLYSFRKILGFVRL